MESVYIICLILLIVFVYRINKYREFPEMQSAWFMFIFLFSAIYGSLEYSWMQFAGTTGPKVILNHFSIYHLYVLILFVMIAFSYLFLNKEINGWKHIPLMFLIEDISYYIDSEKWHKPGEWNDFPEILHFQIGDLFIPGGYTVLIILAVIFYFISFRINKKNVN